MKVWIVVAVGGHAGTRMWDFPTEGPARRHADIIQRRDPGVVCTIVEADVDEPQPAPAPRTVKASRAGGGP